MEKTRYPSHLRLGGTHRRSGRFGKEKISSPFRDLNPGPSSTYRVAILALLQGLSVWCGVCVCVFVCVCVRARMWWISGTGIGVYPSSSLFPVSSNLQIVHDY